MTLLTDWHDKDLTGWQCSEKFDGVQAYWDGVTAWTRGGHKITLPFAMRCALPDGVSLDEELWAGYDVPRASGTWAERMTAAEQYRNGVIIPVAYRRASSTADALGMVIEVQARGGEGIVARDPDAQGYEIGRTKRALQIKEADKDIYL